MNFVIYMETAAVSSIKCASCCLNFFYRKYNQLEWFSHFNL